MLTWDLVRAKVGRDDVTVRELTDAQRAGATALAGVYLERLELGRGRSRYAVQRALRGVDVPARERKIADGLRKLLDDRCTWAMPDGPDPSAVRDTVFRLAAARRRSLGPGDRLDRAAVLDAASIALDMDDAAGVDRRLFGDLKDAWRLMEFEPIEPAALVARYEEANRQALLLRATRVDVVLRDIRPGAARVLFRKLKFLRLLHRVTPREGGYRVEIEGPYALFQQVTKYGLQLALLLPTLDAVGPYELTAEILWGPRRVPRTLRLSGGAPGSLPPDRLPDELAKLKAAFAKLGSPWTLRRSTKIVHLPGVGLCVPDLVFKHPDKGAVYLELLGYWSREAVWKRVDLVEGGLKDRVVFAVSTRLRVSEEVLGDDERGALYVFKGTLHAKELLKRVERVAG